jgi:plastocyanin
MKNLIKNTVLLFALLIGSAAIAQDQGHTPNMDKKSKVIKLKQTPGEFNKKELKLKAGESYVFEITNKGVDHAVGFVVAPKGKPEQENHIKNAYVKETVKDGDSQMTSEVVLEAGEYIFFCPMNPTPQYSIIVE